MTLEQISREILQRAIDDGIVIFNPSYGGASDVAELSAGDLVGVANLLNNRLHNCATAPNSPELENIKIVSTS